ncbi:MAG: acetyl-CoA C-acyltransferase [Myxococcales bacterium]
MLEPEVFIVAAARTPIGSFQGVLGSVSAPRLGATAIQGALKRAGATPDQITHTFMGNVLSAGLGQAPARQAAIYAGIPHRTPATTVSKVCGSGLEAVLLGTRAILVGDHEIVVAGGMESMTNAPYLLPKARQGYRMGHGQLVDALIHDGLWDPYGQFHMGRGGELCASKFELTREAQDAFAKESYRRARSAQEKGEFAAEIEAVEIPGKRGKSTRVEVDEEPTRVNLERIGELEAAFQEGGSITVGNSSKINDGASALVLASRSAVARHGWKPLARIIGYGGCAQAPEWFSTAPIEATREALKRARLTATDVDLYEINEAFAVVTMACAQQLGVPLERVNVRGGAVALGHPIGASGARILTTLLHALRDRGQKRGVATLCIGGGEALAVVVERTD